MDDATDRQLHKLESAAEAHVETLAAAGAAATASEQLVKTLRRLVRRNREQYGDRATQAAQLHGSNIYRTVVLCRDESRFQGLVYYGRQATKLLQKLPGESGGRLSRVYADLAVGHFGCGNLPAAGKANRRAQKLLKKLARTEPQLLREPQYLGVLADTYYTDSMIAGERGNYRAALVLAERAVDLLQEAAQLNPGGLEEHKYRNALDSLLQNVEAFGSSRNLFRIRSRHLDG